MKTTTVERVGAISASGARQPWYVTAAFTEHCLVDGGLVRRPTSMAHAKQMGTPRTACGLWAYSWRGMLDLAFPLVGPSEIGVPVCPRCVERVDRGAT